MKPVLIQVLVRNMRKNAKLPMPTINDVPRRRDKSGLFVSIVLVLILIAVIFM